VYWAVTVVGQKLECHGLVEREAALLRGRRLLDATSSLLARGYHLGEEVSPLALASLGIAVVPALPFYDPEPELRRLWEAGWEVMAAELGDFLLRAGPAQGGDEVQRAFPGAFLLVAQGETAFAARLRQAAGGRRDEEAPVAVLLRVGVARPVVVALQRQGIALLGELRQALREASLDLPRHEAERLRRVLVEGREGLPFVPWSPPPTARREASLSGVRSWEPLLSLVRRFAAEVAEELGRRGMKAGKAEVYLWSEEGVWQAKRRLVPPGGRERLEGALLALLARASLHSPVERLAVAVEGERAPALQQGLFQNQEVRERGVSPRLGGAAGRAMGGAMGGDAMGGTGGIGGRRVARGMGESVADRRELRLSFYDPLRGGPDLGGER